jgi:hypothetical protein
VGGRAAQNGGLQDEATHILDPQTEPMYGVERGGDLLQSQSHMNSHGVQSHHALVQALVLGAHA